MSLKQEVIMLNFESPESIKTLIDNDFDDTLTDFEYELYDITMNEIKKNKKLLKLLDLPSATDIGVNGDIFTGDFYHTVMFKFDVIDAYYGDEGLEDGTSDISFITHIKDWKLDNIESLMFYPDDDEENSYSIYPRFELPLHWKGKFKKEYRDTYV